MITEALDVEVFIVMKKIDELKLKDLEMRRQHLKNRLQLANDRQDKKSTADILRILQQEVDRKWW